MKTIISIVTGALLLMGVYGCSNGNMIIEADKQVTIEETAVALNDEIKSHATYQNLLAKGYTLSITETAQGMVTIQARKSDPNTNILGYMVDLREDYSDMILIGGITYDFSAYIYLFDEQNQVKETIVAEECELYYSSGEPVASCTESDLKIAAEVRMEAQNVMQEVSMEGEQLLEFFRFCAQAIQ